MKVTEVDEEDVDEEESVEELEDDTDEFDTASPEVGSVDEEVLTFYVFATFSAQLCMYYVLALIRHHWQ